VIINENQLQLFILQNYLFISFLKVNLSQNFYNFLDMENKFYEENKFSLINEIFYLQVDKIID